MQTEMSMNKCLLSILFKFAHWIYVRLHNQSDVLPIWKSRRLIHSIEISNAYEFFSGKLSDYRISFIQWNHMFWSTLNLCYIVRWEIQRPILSGIIWVTNYSLRMLPNRVLIKLKPSSASCCFLDFVGLRGVIFHETRHTTALARASLEQLCLV